MSLSLKTRNRLRSVVAVGLCAGVLAGCGSARPGVAYDVAGQSTSLGEVDVMSAAACEALIPQLQTSQVVLPMSQIRTIAVANMINGTIAEIFSAEEGIEPGPAYEERRAYFESAAEAIDEDLRDAYVDINTMNMLYTDVATQLGQRLLAEGGNTEATDEEASAAGTEALKVWAQDADIVIDPRFNIAVVDGVLSPQDESLAVAVSDFSVARTSDQEFSYAATLPEDQVCG